MLQALMHLLAQPEVLTHLLLTLQRKHIWTEQSIMLALYNHNMLLPLSQTV